MKLIKRYIKSLPKSERDGRILFLGKRHKIRVEKLFAKHHEIGVGV